jgi:hypothetical protein
MFDSRNPDDVRAMTSRELRLLGQARAAALNSSQRQARQMSSKQPDRSQDGTQNNESPPSTHGYQVNDWVKLRNHARLKFQLRWKGPYIIREIGPHGTYYLMKPDGTFLSNPANQVDLRPWLSIQMIYSQGVKKKRGEYC